ncbi:ABC transporter permease [Lacisediminihabitans sp. FW035]
MENKDVSLNDEFAQHPPLPEPVRPPAGRSHAMTTTVRAPRSTAPETVNLPRRRPGLRRLRKSLRLHWQLYLLIAVPLAYFVIFKYIPMANAVIAFKSYNVVQGIWGSTWVGTENFVAFFTNPVFGTLLQNTLSLSLYTVIASFPIPIILALALNEVRLRVFKKTVQMVTFAPYFISSVVVVSMTILILGPRVGIVNQIFGLFGGRPVDFLGNPDNFRHIFVWTDVWQSAGFWTIIYLSALSAIDVSLYEAAKVDGASRLQKIIHVDIPGIMPTAAIILILSAGNIMTLGWEKAFLLQNPLNLQNSEIINTYVYKIGLLNADFSQAAAVGLFNAGINLVLLLTVNWVAKRLTGSGLWS